MGNIMSERVNKLEEDAFAVDFDHGMKRRNLRNLIVKGTE